MGAVSKSFKARYYAGETAKVAVDAPGAAAVKVVVGSAEFALSDADGTWCVSIPTASLVGNVVFTFFVTGEDGSVEVPDGGRGSFTVLCAGRSAKREIIEKIDAAIQTWGTNPNRSITVGEISISYKSLSELLAIRAQYLQMAEAEENGRALSCGVRIVEVCF